MRNAAQYVAEAEELLRDILAPLKSGYITTESTAAARARQKLEERIKDFLGSGGIVFESSRAGTSPEGIPLPIIRELLKIRDELVKQDPNEAYHILYGIACPGRDSTEPWANWEALLKAEDEVPEGLGPDTPPPPRKYLKDGSLPVANGILPPLYNRGEIVRFPNNEPRSKKMLPVITGRVSSYNYIFSDDNSHYVPMLALNVVGFDQPLAVPEFLINQFLRA